MPSKWQAVSAARDYHVTIEGHAYSVPHGLVGERLEARITAVTVEVFYRGKRVAAHPRSDDPHQPTTDPAHMPDSHRAWARRDPAQLIEWAEGVGVNTATLMRRVLESNAVESQAWRSGSGLRKLGDKYGAERTEEACRRALRFGAASYRPVERMLKHGLDQRPLADESEDDTPIEHDQVRGPEYYLN